MNGKVITEILFAELPIKFGYIKYFLDFKLGNHRIAISHLCIRTIVIVQINAF